ncbi:MAG: acyltransferase family protein, partial [Chloroflexota bacterium]|nr:acyltransferase family protein [Chloroflexota bacterium]
MRQESAAAVGGVAVAAPDRLGKQGVALPTRLGYVDGLRALAALYVVVGHCMATVWPFQAPDGIAGPLANLLQFGHYAVSAFIVLSGFSLMLPVA